VPGTVNIGERRLKHFLSLGDCTKTQLSQRSSEVVVDYTRYCFNYQHRNRMNIKGFSTLEYPFRFTFLTVRQPQAAQQPCQLATGFEPLRLRLTSLRELTYAKTPTKCM